MAARKLAIMGEAQAGTTIVVSIDGNQVFNGEVNVTAVPDFQGASQPLFYNLANVSFDNNNEEWQNRSLTIQTVNGELDFKDVWFNLVLAVNPALSAQEIPYMDAANIPVEISQSVASKGGWRIVSADAFGSQVPEQVSDISSFDIRSNVIVDGETQTGENNPDPLWTPLAGWRFQIPAGSILTCDIDIPPELVT